MPRRNGYASARNSLREAATRISSESIIDIPNSRIRDSEFNKNIPMKGIESLADSMRKEGKLLEPILVYDLGDGSYELVSGHRRREAWCNILGNETIKCRVLPYPADEETRFRQHADANIETRDKDADFWLAEIQNARALIEREEQQKEEEDSDYVPLYEDEKLQKISELINPSGQATGTSKMQIRRYEGYGRLIPEMRALTRFGLSANTLYIAYSHTPKLTEEQQRQLADEVEAYFQQESGDGADNTKELSRGDFQRMVRGVADGKKPSKTPKRPDYATRLGGLEKNLVRSLRKARTDEDRQTALDEIGRLRQTLDELEEELKA
ncbi:MAG: ParB/RepB/Spo0J family partition protein [Chordicoccus sp.]